MVSTFAQQLIAECNAGVKRNWRELITMENIRFLAEHGIYMISHAVKTVLPYEEVEEIEEALTVFKELGFDVQLTMLSHYGHNDEFQIAVRWTMKELVRDVGLEMYELAHSSEVLYDEKFLLKYASLGRSTIQYYGKRPREVEQIFQDLGIEHSCCETGDSDTPVEINGMWWNRVEE